MTSADTISAKVEFLKSQIVGPNDIEIAVVIPVYRGEEFVAELCSRLHESLSTISSKYSIILVDDGSPDDAWFRIKDEASKDDRVIGLQLTRNFGQHYAITAGLDIANANWVVVMDGDLQDRPEEIPGLYQLAVSNQVDVVIAGRAVREDAIGRKLGSYVFNKALNVLSGLDMRSSHGNFRIMKRDVHQAFHQLREHMRFYPAIMQWLGFKTAILNTHRPARPSGKSSYNFRKLFRLAVEATVAYSERPLYFSIVIGFLISATALLAGIAVIARKFIWGIDIAGWASLFAGAAFIGGLQIFLLGIVGLYVGKSFQEVKKRPLYLIRDAAHENLFHIKLKQED